jgi:hypothetical protein
VLEHKQSNDVGADRCGETQCCVIERNASGDCGIDEQHHQRFVLFVNRHGDWRPFDASFCNDKLALRATSSLTTSMRPHAQRRDTLYREIVDVVDVCTSVEQKSDNLDMAELSGEMQCRAVLLVDASVDIDRAASNQ